MQKRKKALSPVKKLLSPVLMALLLWTNIFMFLSASAQPGPYNPYNPYKGKSNPYKSQINSSSRRQSPVSPYAHKAQAPEYVDDTIIIHTRPGSGMDEAKEIIDDVDGTLIRSLHVNAGNYDILFVKPNNGQPDSTIKAIQKEIRDKNDKNIGSVRRYHKLRPMQAVPNDQYYPSEWHLPDIGWTQAFNAFGNSQVSTPTLIILDTGTVTIPTDNEFVNVVQYCGVSNPPYFPPPVIVPETPHDVEGHGTACATTAAAATNNSYDCAGVGSIQLSNPMKLFMFRIEYSTSNGYVDFVDSLVFIANNPGLFNNGHGAAISISWGPDAWGDYAEEQQTLDGEGFSVFWAAGNDGAIYTDPPSDYATAVMASQSNDQLAGFSSIVGNTPWTAPGSGIESDAGDWSGTSAACPIFASCVALTQSFSSGMTAKQAAQIVFQTCRTVTQTTGTATGKTLAIPDLYNAINTALGRTAPSSNSTTSSGPGPTTSWSKTKGNPSRSITTPNASSSENGSNAGQSGNSSVNTLTLRAQ